MSNTCSLGIFSLSYSYLLLTIGVNENYKECSQERFTQNMKCNMKEEKKEIVEGWDTKINDGAANLSFSVSILWGTLDHKWTYNRSNISSDSKQQQSPENVTCKKRKKKKSDPVILII